METEAKRLTWRKSSRSGTQGNCVEVATDGTEIYVRDSKRPDDGHLTVDRDAFRSFVGWLRSYTRKARYPW